MGIEYIRLLQGISAPVLLAVGLLLLAWAYRNAGGFGPMLAARSRFTSFPAFLKFLIPALNGTVGFWATVSLNIPDFTAFARKPARADHRTSACAADHDDSLRIHRHRCDFGNGSNLRHRHLRSRHCFSRFPLARGGRYLTDRDSAGHIEREHRRERRPPANDFSQFVAATYQFPHRWRNYLLMGIVLMPWETSRRLQHPFILGWLGGYAAFLGPVAGIMICDYFVIRKRILQVDDLYLRRRHLRNIRKWLQLEGRDRACARSWHPR